MNKDQKFEKIQANENLIEFEIHRSKFTLVPKKYGFKLFAILDSPVISTVSDRGFQVSSNDLLLKMFEERQGGLK